MTKTASDSKQRNFAKGKIPALRIEGRYKRTHRQTSAHTSAARQNIGKFRKNRNSRVTEKRGEKKKRKGGQKKKKTILNFFVFGSARMEAANGPRRPGSCRPAYTAHTAHAAHTLHTLHLHAARTCKKSLNTPRLESFGKKKKPKFRQR